MVYWAILVWQDYRNYARGCNKIAHKQNRGKLIKNYQLSSIFYIFNRQKGPEGPFSLV